jgi:hypothetical protein
MNWNTRNVSDMLVAVYMIINGCEWFYLSLNSELLPILGKNAIFLRLQDRGWPKWWMRVSSELALRIGVQRGAAAIVLLGLTLFVTAADSTTSPVISVLALVSVITFNATIGMGLEGADQMATLVLFANASTALFPHLQKAVDLFIMAQLVLSYGVAGIAKLLSTEWRSGRALAMILSTHSLGIGNARLLVRHAPTARVICGSIIVFELSWFGAPFNQELALVLMMFGVVFHFSSSWIMGLNLFPWAFLSAYPLAINGIHRLHS